MTHLARAAEDEAIVPLSLSTDLPDLAQLTLGPSSTGVALGRSRKLPSLPMELKKEVILHCD